MPYNILPYTRRRAKTFNVKVRPSHNRTKKIDVLDKQGRVLASVGGIGYMDYPTYIQKKGSRYAKERRRLYRIRHQKDRHRKNTPGWYADKLLW